MKKRRWLAGLVTIAIGVSASAIPVKTLSAAGKAFEGWIVDEAQWKRSEDGTVITSKGGVLNAMEADGPVNANQIEFSVAIREVQSNVDGNVGLYYECENGEHFFFEYNSVLQFLRIRKLVDGIAVTENLVPYVMEQGEWYDCRVRLLPSRIEFYVNNTLMLSQTENYGNIFQNGTCHVQGYNTIPSFRDCTFSVYNEEKPDETDWIYNANWTLVADGEVTSNGTETICKIESRGSVNVNSIEFSAKIEAVRSDVDGNIGVYYQCGNGEDVFFEYNTVLHLARIRRFTGGADQQVSAQVPLNLTTGEWHDFKVILDEEIILFYIDGKNVCSAPGAYGDMFAGGRCRIQGYNTTISVKLENLKNDMETVYKYDFEFRKASSVNGFIAQNGTVSQQDGLLIYTICGNASTLETPVLQTSAGDRYAALFPLRNTVFLRMKNGTNAERLKVSVITTDQTRYSDSTTKTIPILPNSEFQSYFVNLSDLNLSGYLRQIRLEAVGAESGSIEIDAISFERETPVIASAGEILTCTADRDTITITGKLHEAYRNKKVSLYETAISNYSESLTGTPLISAAADGVDFTIQIPLYSGNVSRLSSQFLVGVEGVKCGGKFAVSNYRDFQDNPYAFSLPARSVRVTDAPFSAKGDAFTDDTAAIQAAIDTIHKQGGGTVILPGEPENPYGKRYMVTNLLLKDNVELRIETGAVVWQSPRLEQYRYDAVYGHDIVIPGVNWTHACLCKNLPLIQAYESANIRVTGGGAIRSMDSGSECKDGVDGSTIWTGCPSRIHVVPIGFYGCKNVEISDITLLRTNNYHIVTYACENVYVGNVTMKEVTCASGDGISISMGTHDVMVNRCFLFSNDDSVVLCSSYNDPRGLVWWKAKPESDNSVQNITVCHSYLVGGHGVTFITWGTDNPDLSKNEIKNIHVYDNVLNWIGSWPDNPYYGKQPFDNTEGDDYSPVKQVRILNNRILTAPDIGPIQATDFVTDTILHSSEQFQNGNFEREDPLHPDWVSGLSNWTVQEKGGTVSTIKQDTGYCAMVSGKTILAQGLYQKEGGRRFSADVKVASGTVRMFVCDILTGEILADKYVTAKEFETVSLTYFGTNRNLYLGIEVTTEDGIAYLDNAKVESIPDADVKLEKISDGEDPKPDDPAPEEPKPENPKTGRALPDLFALLLSVLLLGCCALPVFRKKRKTSIL
ncbi:MAG: glycosyl hydrolase family 28 protein [Clostridia bacterium]